MSIPEKDILKSPPAKRRKTESEGNGPPREPVIDKNFYSRQLYVLGHEAMQRMLSSSVLISGMGGLGVEVAKNIILCGVHSVTLHDCTLCTLDDLSSQFYLSRCDIGKNRAEACINRLSELNPRVSVNGYYGELSHDFVTRFDAVVLTDSVLEEQLRVSSALHLVNIPLVVASTKGLFAQVFCDFGEAFEVLDTNRESPSSAMIKNITKDNEGVVTCLSDVCHDLGDNDFVTFSGIEGMTELNGCEPKQVRVLGPYTFAIGNTSHYSEYVGGGTVKLTIWPQTMNFKSLSGSLNDPRFLVFDPSKIEHINQTHLAFKTLHHFEKIHNRVPRPWNAEDAEEFINIATSTKQDEESNCGINIELFTLFSKVCSGQVCPMNSVIGGIVAQEVIKACSGKFAPINQWLYFDAIECLPESRVIPEINCRSTDSRYNSQIAVFGKDFQNKLSSLKYFLVGAGAIGCELLKNFAMMGIGEISSGQIIVADMDLISQSDLNRQFMYRSEDLGKSKSLTVATSVRKMNLNINIIGYENKVESKSENVFHDDFFENVDGVAVAVDNIESRKYLNRKIIYHRKPLIESGILGTKGSTQVVVPYLTESYSCSQDQNEPNVPKFVLDSFPSSTGHTLLWGRRIFYQLFRIHPEKAQLYLRDPDFYDHFIDFSNVQSIQLLENLKRSLVDEIPRDFVDCVMWARFQWQEQFTEKITKLLNQIPCDATTATGQPFWSLPRKCPTPLTFSVENPIHLDFIYAAANLRASLYGIPQNTNREIISEIVQNIVDEKSDSISTTTANKVVSNVSNSSVNSGHERIAQLLYELPHRDLLSDVVIKPVHIDFDDDSNFQIDFILAASNLKAIIYGITPTNRHTCKLIAGEIIPTIITTASVVAGLSSLELIKVTQGLHEKHHYRNGFINLALPFIGFSEPVSPWKQTYYSNEWTIWDRFEVQGELSLTEFIDHFKNIHSLVINVIYHGSSLLFSEFLPHASLQEILTLPMSRVLRRMSGQDLHHQVRYLIFNMVCVDLAGNDVEVPYVCYAIPTNAVEL